MKGTQQTESLEIQSAFFQKVTDYRLLVKLRLTLTVVFSSVMAYLIVQPQAHWLPVTLLAFGGFLVTGAANALNQVLEKDYDRLMKRTANRPLAAGRMTISEGVMAAGFMSLVGITLLATFNPLSAFLGMLSLLTYAFLYTPLKRVGPVAVFVGAIAGALPVLIGCVAAQGEITRLGVTLFSIQFLWQFPHFWSIGFLGQKDYVKAGYKFLPIQDGLLESGVRFQAFLYSIFLLFVGFSLYYTGFVSSISGLIFGLVTIFFCVLGWKFYRYPERASALRLMFFSFVYIPAVLIILFIDRLIF